jgi:superfamily II DNA/RNA helicase
MRTGDTPGKERQALVRTPPDILITTPESLYLMLTSRARETLRSVEYVIIDEIHAMAPTKRGAHLMLSLERLDEIAHKPPQRIGLSATHSSVATTRTARDRSRSSTPGRARSSTSRSSCRSTTWRSSGRIWCRCSTGRSTPSANRGRASGRTCTRASSS